MDKNEKESHEDNILSFFQIIYPIIETLISMQKNGIFGQPYISYADFCLLSPCGPRHSPQVDIPPLHSNFAITQFQLVFEFKLNLIS